MAQFTEAEFKAGIPLYRGDAPSGGERAFDLESLNIMLDDAEELVWLYEQELDEHDILNIQITAINANIADLINNNNNNNNNNDNDNNNNNYVDNL